MELSSSQRVNLDLTATRPVYVARIAHSGFEELLSGTGRVVFDGEIYAAGGISIKSITDNQTATLELPVTAARMGDIQNGTWRNGVCKIYAIPASPDDDGEFEASAGMLVLDGFIDSSNYSGGDRITCNATQTGMGRNLTPRNTLSEVCNHINPPGTVLAWQDDKLTLESRR